MIDEKIASQGSSLVTLSNLINSNKLLFDQFKTNYYNDFASTNTTLSFHLDEIEKHYALIAGLTAAMDTYQTFNNNLLADTSSNFINKLSTLENKVLADALVNDEKLNTLLNLDDVSLNELIDILNYFSSIDLSSATIADFMSETSSKITQLNNDFDALEDFSNTNFTELNKKTVENNLLFSKILTRMTNNEVKIYHNIPLKKYQMIFNFVY